MRLYLDTSVILRCVEGAGPERDAALRWVALAAGSVGGTILGSRLVRAECLVVPLRTRDQALIDTYEGFFRDSGIVLVDISAEILDLATSIFAYHRIRMADAIHTATAIFGDCDALVARDEPWTKKGPIKWPAPSVLVGTRRPGTTITTRGRPACDKGDIVPAISPTRRHRARS